MFVEVIISCGDSMNVKIEEDEDRNDEEMPDTGAFSCCSTIKPDL